MLNVGMETAPAILVEKDCSVYPYTPDATNSSFIVKGHTAPAITKYTHSPHERPFSEESENFFSDFCNLS
jgi:hypothetical protein